MKFTMNEHVVWNTHILKVCTNMHTVAQFTIKTYTTMGMYDTYV